MTDASRNPCPNEALDPEGDVLICVPHTSRVLDMLSELGMDVPSLSSLAWSAIRGLCATAESTTTTKGT